MSSGPSRFEMKYTPRPSEDQTGVWLSAVQTVRYRMPPSAAETATMALAARFPNIGPTIAYDAFPDAQAMVPPSGDQRQLLALRTTARNRAVSPAPCTKSEAATVNAMVLSSRAHSAEVIGLPRRARTSWRAGPPDAGALKTAPPAR